MTEACCEHVAAVNTQLYTRAVCCWRAAASRPFHPGPAARKGEEHDFLAFLYTHAGAPREARASWPAKQPWSAHGRVAML